MVTAGGITGVVERLSIRSLGLRDLQGVYHIVPFSSVEMDRIVNDRQVAGPNFATVIDDGSALSISARSIVPGAGAEGARDLIATLDLAGGGRIDLSAAQGTLGTDEGQARLSGGVALRSADGYRLEGAAFDIDRGAKARVVSDGPVTGTGPPGTIEAGGMTLARTGDDYVLNFTDGVKLVYLPPEVDGE